MSVSYVLENLFSRLEIVVCRNEFERSSEVKIERKKSAVVVIPGAGHNTAVE